MESWNNFYEISGGNSPKLYTRNLILKYRHIFHQGNESRRDYLTDIHRYIFIPKNVYIEAIQKFCLIPCGNGTAL